MAQDQSTARGSKGRHREIIIVGTASKIVVPKVRPSHAQEVWGCNSCYELQPHLSRLYFMDHLSIWLDKAHDFVVRMNEISADKISCYAWDEIKGCRAFRMAEARRLTPGRAPYFTSTIAYMIAEAILEAPDIITIDGILKMPGSHDYMEQKACLDYWCGIAIGRGIETRISDDSAIGRAPMSMSGLYGYERPEDEDKYWREYSRLAQAHKNFARAGINWVKLDR